MVEQYICNKTYIILCEGSSEKAYIQLINRLLTKNNIKITFAAKEIGTGHFSDVEKAYKKQCKENKKIDKVIWVDKDIYKRNDRNNGIEYAGKVDNIPDFLFTTYNFEDFLVMHLDDNIIDTWQQILNTKGHFSTPLKSSEYIPLIKDNIDIFNNYEKGDIPFEITLDNIRQAYKIHQNLTMNFKCDFLDFLSSITGHWL